jgi:hypothetical protein
VFLLKNKEQNVTQANQISYSQHYTRLDVAPWLASIKQELSNPLYDCPYHDTADDD